MKTGIRRYLLGLAVAGTALLTAGSANAAMVMVVNGTRVAMVSLQSKPAQSPKWSMDLLNRRALGIGRAVVVNLPNGQSCNYDFFAMFYDGHKVQKKNINVCKRGPVTITDI